MKRSTRMILLAGIATAIAVPTAHADVYKPDPMASTNPMASSDPWASSNLYRHHSRTVTRVRPTGFSDGRLGSLGLRWAE